MMPCSCALLESMCLIFAARNRCQRKRTRRVTGRTVLLDLRTTHRHAPISSCCPAGATKSSGHASRSRRVQRSRATSYDGPRIPFPVSLYTIPHLAVYHSPSRCIPFPISLPAFHTVEKERKYRAPCTLPWDQPMQPYFGGRFEPALQTYPRSNHYTSSDTYDVVRANADVE